MDCPNCGTYRWDTSVECPNCKAPAITTVDPMAEPTPSIAAGEITSAPTATATIAAEPVESTAPAQTLAPPAPWQSAKPYRPSGRMASGSFGRIALSALGAALGIGLLYHYITKFINIFLLMPIVGGVIVGTIISGGVTKGRCRNPMVAAAVGLIAGLIAYGGDIVLNAIEDRSAMVASLSQDLVQDNGMPPAQATQYAEKLLTPWNTVRYDLAIHAAAGVSISHYGTGGVPITGVGYYGIVLLETVLFAGFAAALPMGTAKKRYCETCDNWFRVENAYAVSPTAQSPLSAAVDAHDWQAAARIEQQAPVRTKAHMSVEVQRCPTCNDAVIGATTTDGKNTRKLWERFLPVDDVQRLIAIGKLKST